VLRHARVSLSGMIRAVLKRLLLLLIPAAVIADPLEEAVRLLADKIAVHFDASERPRVVARNLSSMPATEIAKAQAELARALRRRVRNGHVVEVALTVSENLNGYLLVAEIRKKEEKIVEMVSFKPETPPAPPALVPVHKQLLWQQTEIMLDLAVVGGEMLVLEPQRLVRYERSEGRWVQKESAPITAPSVRDPRARMEIEQNRVSVFLPGTVCRGTWQPLNVVCERGIADFTLGGAQVHFTPWRNTLEGEYKTLHEGAGDAIPVCGGNVLASGNGGMDSEDTITLFEGATRISEAADLPGPVTALWPASDGATAIVLNLSTRQYAAYALSVDCSG
jgi:hypothetical protein